MSGADITSYLMNPETDAIVFAGDLTEGMVVLPESREYRASKGGQDGELRQRHQSFRVVTRLRRVPNQVYEGGVHITFVSQRPDGYQEVQYAGPNFPFIARKPIPADGEATS